MLGDRKIAHLDLDAFFVSCELLRRPELIDQPVIIAGRGSRAVVSTASYQARALGVGSGIPASKARRLCPQGIFLGVDMKYYRQRSQEVMELIAGLKVPRERASVDEVYLDISGLEDPITRIRQLVSEIKEQLRLDASVGIGPNKLIAKIASDLDKPQGFTVLDLEQARQRLGPERVKLIPGIGPKTAERLLSLGIEAIGELGDYPLEDLEAAFGPRRGLDLHRKGLLLSDAPIAQRVAKSRSVETTFERDLLNIDNLIKVLDKQSQKLSQQLIERKQTGKTIGIKIRLKDFTTVTRVKTLSQPTNDSQLIFETAKELLIKYHPPTAVRLLGVRVAGFTGKAES